MIVNWNIAVTFFVVIQEASIESLICERHLVTVSINSYLFMLKLIFQELEEELSTVVMERDGLQKSLKVLQEEYQSVAKEAKVFHCTAVHNFFPTVISHLINIPRDFLKSPSSCLFSTRRTKDFSYLIGANKRVAAPQPIRGPLDIPWGPTCQTMLNET